MRFWDASAIVALIALEKETGDCRALLAEDSDIVVWLLTPVEVISALTRRLREKSLKPIELSKAKEQLTALEKAWSEVISVERVRDRARRLLETHPLRAADSLQLAAALLASEENPQGFPFVTLDERLGGAAEREGFQVLGV
ncbi:MAG TPA: type II toxin-antitoxin system VapC family toxin [Candidatus Udaeobacter sp.]|nr:type II toxin-antitoxin system VapC family toxin [Candidatus Udaeobacter sp.]